MVRIGFDTSSLLRSLNATAGSLLQNFEKLGSGERIVRAADDAAGLAISERLSAIERSLEQGQRNLGDGLGLVRTAEGGLSQIGDQLGRLRELSVQAQNGTLSDQDRATIQAEYDQITAEITRVSESTEFNGKSLLDGELQGDGSVGLEDGAAGEDIEIAVTDQSAAALGIAGRDVADPGTIDALDAAIDSVSRTRADLGAVSNRIEFSIDNLRNSQENLAEARSRITDVDFAEATAKLTRDRILQQAQLGLAAQGNALAERSLRLLA